MNAWSLSGHDNRLLCGGFVGGISRMIEHSIDNRHFKLLRWV
jgi:hypothetical protein